MVDMKGRTPEIPNAEQTERGAFNVMPQTETRIPNTPFVVWHGGHANAFVQVLSDGALDLSGPNHWIVRAQ